MVTRKKIPQSLAEEVLFASDRTCCCCHMPGKSVQIAHIDDDPSNNSFDNLAVLCLEHHDEAHRKNRLTRNLTLGLLRLYNQQWRDVVKGHLLPDKEIRDLREYQQEVMLEISIVCQHWVTTFIAYAQGPAAFLFEQEKQTLAYLAENSKYPYSEETWRRLHSVANEHLTPIVEKLQRILSLHSQVIPVHLKTSMLRSLRWLENFPNTYSYK